VGYNRRCDEMRGEREGAGGGEERKKLLEVEEGSEQ